MSAGGPLLHPLNALARVCIQVPGLTLYDIHRKPRRLRRSESRENAAKDGGAGGFEGEEDGMSSKDNALSLSTTSAMGVEVKLEYISRKRMRAEGPSGKEGSVEKEEQDAQRGEDKAGNNTVQGHIDVQAKVADAGSILRGNPVDAAVGEARMDTRNLGMKDGEARSGKGHKEARLSASDKNAVRRSQEGNESSCGIETEVDRCEGGWKSCESTEVTQMDGRSAEDVAQVLLVARPVRSLNMELTCPICLGILQVSG